MFCKRRNLIYFALIFVLALLQVQVLSMNGAYGQSKDSSTTEEVKLKITNEDIEAPDKDSPNIDSLIVDKSNTEVIGTVFKFTAISEDENLEYEWTLYKDSVEIYKKDYSKENYLDFTMSELGKYLAVATIRDENGNTGSKLSEEINIVLPIRMNAVSVDKQGNQPVGTPLHFSVSAEGDDLVYHWYIFRDSNVVYDGLLSQNNNILYTPDKPGIYKGLVYVKDRYDQCIREYSEEIIIYEKVVSEKEKLEALINERGYSSKTNDYMWVDTEKNLIYVFEGENKNWRLAKTMVCTDGKASTPTVKGNFEVKGRAPWLTSYSGDVKAKYKVRFYGNYYFHSILFDAKGKKIVDSRLGESLSHGCVRLSVEDAKWVYDHIKDGTGVHVE